MAVARGAWRAGAVHDGAHASSPAGKITRTYPFNYILIINSYTRYNSRGYTRPEATIKVGHGRL